MKKSMIFKVKITTKAVEKKPEKVQAWSESHPDLCYDQTQCSIHRANQANRRAGHCESVIYPMVEIIWIEIWNETYFEVPIKIRKWAWSSQ